LIHPAPLKLIELLAEYDERDGIALLQPIAMLV